MISKRFSPHIEEVLTDIHHHCDDFDKPNFSVVDYINSHLVDFSSFSLGALVKEVDTTIRHKNDNLRTAVSVERTKSLNSDESLSKTKATLSTLKSRVKEIKGQASSGEETVKELTTHIRELDIAKSNLTSSIDTLQSMEMWMLQLHFVSSSFKRRKYRETADALQESLRLQSRFTKFSRLSRVCELNERLKQLCGDMEYFIRNSIFGELNWDSVNPRELSEVCQLVDLMDEKCRNRIRDKFVEKSLETYSARFKRGTEDAKLEKTERRYVFIRTLLQKYEDTFPNVFPVRWCVPQELCVFFCLRTKEDLDYQLQESSGQMDMVVLTYVLQKTLDIEKELTEMMAWDTDFSGRDSLPVYKYNSLILSAFKAHLNLFVENEDRLLGNALRGQTVIGDGTVSSSDKSDGEYHVDPVLPLAKNIFLFISQSLKRSLRISQPEVLLEMSVVWRKYLLLLANDMFQAIPLKCVASNDVRQTCLISCTSRFSQITSQDLRREIVVRSEASTRDVGFEQVIDKFAEVYSKSVHTLVEGLSFTLLPHLNSYGGGGFLLNREVNVDGVPTHEESRSIRSIISALHGFFAHCCAILSNQILRFVVEKIAALIIPSFVGCLYSMRKMSDDAINTMRVDSVLFEKAFLQLPNYNAPDRFSSVELTSFAKLVRREFSHLHLALKVLQVSHTVDVLAEVYYEVMCPEDRSIQNFVRLADLKEFRRDELRPWITNLSNRGVVEATKRDLEREAARGLSIGGTI